MSARPKLKNPTSALVIVVLTLGMLNILRDRLESETDLIKELVKTSRSSAYSHGSMSTSHVRHFFSTGRESVKGLKKD
jgi:hypothetical protein